MRKLIVSTFLTLDGVMQAPGGPEEDVSGGFEHGGWSFGYWDEAMGKRMGEATSTPFDLLLGRKTYEIFAAHWPYSNEPIADVLNSARKYVASRTLEEVSWQNSVLLRGDVAEAVAGLKDEEGPEIQVHGSSGLIQSLLAHGLVDELRLWTFPVVLGTGKRLFGEGTVPAGLELVDSATSTTGVVMATYRTGAAIRYGSFELAEPSEAEIGRRETVAKEN
jgi:dihydrofolate reductase